VFLLSSRISRSPAAWPGCAAAGCWSSAAAAFVARDDTEAEVDRLERAKIHPLRGDGAAVLLLCMNQCYSFALSEIQAACSRVMSVCVYAPNKLWPPSSSLSWGGLQ